MDARLRTHHTIRQARCRQGRPDACLSRPDILSRLQRHRPCGRYEGRFGAVACQEDYDRPPSRPAHGHSSDHISPAYVEHLRTRVPYNMAVGRIRRDVAQVCRVHILRYDDRHGRIHLQLYTSGNFLYRQPIADQGHRQGQDIPQRIQQLQPVGNTSARPSDEPETQRVWRHSRLLLHHLAPRYARLPLHQG